MSFYLVESRDRKYFSIYYPHIYKSPQLFIYLVVIIFSFSAYFNNGFPIRGDINKAANLNELVMPNRSNGYCFRDFSGSATANNSDLLCTLGNPSDETKILLFGDSFAGHYEPFIELLAFELGVSVDSITTNWCFPSLSRSFTGPKNHLSYKACLESRAYLTSNIDQYDTIIISGMWLNIMSSSYFVGVTEIIDYLAGKGKKVIILPSPQLYSTNVKRRFEVSLFSSSFPFDITQYYSDQDSKVQNIHNQLRALSLRNDRVYFIERSDLFNNSGMFSINGNFYPYALDSAHISVLGSKNLMRKFKTTRAYSSLIQFLSNK